MGNKISAQDPRDVRMQAQKEENVESDLLSRLDQEIADAHKKRPQSNKVVQNPVETHKAAHVRKSSHQNAAARTSTKKSKKKSKMVQVTDDAQDKAIISLQGVLGEASADDLSETAAAPSSEALVAQQHTSDNKKATMLKETAADVLRATPCEGNSDGEYCTADCKGDSPTCAEQCVAGQAATGGNGDDANTCAECAADEFADHGAHACVANCPNGTTSNSDTKDCDVCAASEFADHAAHACVATCPAGAAENSTNRDCEACAADEFADHEAQTCVATCPNGTTANSDTQDCDKDHLAAAAPVVAAASSSAAFAEAAFHHPQLVLKETKATKKKTKKKADNNRAADNSEDDEPAKPAKPVNAFSSDWSFSNFLDQSN